MVSDVRKNYYKISMALEPNGTVSDRYFCPRGASRVLANNSIICLRGHRLATPRGFAGIPIGSDAPFPLTETRGSIRLEPSCRTHAIDVLVTANFIYVDRNRHNSGGEYAKRV